MLQMRRAAKPQRPWRVTMSGGNWHPGGKKSLAPGKGSYRFAKTQVMSGLPWPASHKLHPWHLGRGLFSVTRGCQLSKAANGPGLAPFSSTGGHIYEDFSRLTVGHIVLLGPQSNTAPPLTHLREDKVKHTRGS